MARKHRSLRAAFVVERMETVSCTKRDVGIFARRKSWGCGTKHTAESKLLVTKCLVCDASRTRHCARYQRAISQFLGNFFT